jgi:hypothetical protein
MRARSHAALALQIFVVLVLAGCRHKYPLHAEHSFRQACELQGGSTSRCGCTLNWLEDHVSFTDFEAADATATRTGVVPNNIAEGIASCH